MIKFPYGNSDFYQIITEDYLYVDRTDRIPLLEKIGKSLLFLRPRRFGKSLLLTMLENYYDVAKAAEFDLLFGHLAVGQYPTLLHNQYLVMRMDFSVVTPKPTYEAQQRVLTSYLNAEIRGFASKYRAWLPEPILINETDATASFWSVLNAVQSSNHKLYLLVDEYDNFANEVLMGNELLSQERYEALVFGEGDFKGIFKAIKGAMSGRGLDRVFIAGVSPVVLYDISSGFNIAENIYLRDDLNDLCGFTEREVAVILHQVAADCQLSEEQTAEAMMLMQAYYNGSLFTDEGGERVYNPTSTFYFLKYFQRTCRYPRKMLDSNLAPDHSKLAYVASLPKGEEVILNIIDKNTPVIVQELEDRFGIKQMLAESNTEAFMLALLYYLGVLTLTDEITSEGKQILRIPNLVMERLYAERLREMLLPDAGLRDDAQEAAEELYQKGEMTPLADFLEARIFPIFDNRDYLQANELTIKTAFLMLLFNDIFYMMDSEQPLRRGYADLTMILRPEMRQYHLFDVLLELKLVKLSTLGLNARTVRAMTREELLALPSVQAELAQAEQQGKEYGESLTAKYGAKLKLRTFAVVAIGFDRLVWRAAAVDEVQTLRTE